MTITSADIPKYSPYTVNETTFTTAMFTDYLEQAEDLMDEIAPDEMPTSIWNRCLALLVAHFYETKNGVVEVKSGDPGEFRWVQPGRTAFWIQAMDLVKQFKGLAQAPSTSSAVQRTDATMLTLQLDGDDIPTFFSE